jgi:hypothetical protein
LQATALQARAPCINRVVIGRWTTHRPLEHGHHPGERPRQWRPLRAAEQADETLEREGQMDGVIWLQIAKACEELLREWQSDEPVD